VNDPQSVRYRIATSGIGKAAKLEGLRDSQWTTWMVTLEAPPDGDRTQLTIAGRNPMTGAVVANLTPAFADEIGVADMSGVVVLGAQRRSIARRYGFNGGDIIVEVNGTAIADVNTLKSELDKGNTSGWRIVVKRDGQLHTLEVRA